MKTGKKPKKTCLEENRELNQQLSEMDLQKRQDVSDIKRVEHEVLESERQYRTLFEFAKDAILVMNASTGAFIDYNGKAVTLTGYSRKEMAGLNHMLLFPEEIRENMNKHFQELLKGKKSFMVESVIVNKEGLRIPVEINASGKIVLGDRIVHFSVIRDITDRKNAQNALIESEKRYKELFRNAVLGFFKIGRDDTFVEINPAFARILGYSSPRKLISNKIQISRLFVNPDDFMKLKIQLVNTRIVKGFETEVLKQNGSPIWISLYAGRVDERDNSIFYEGSIEDITFRKKMEKRINAAHENLEKTIMERTKELERSRKAALSMMQDANSQRHNAEEMMKKLEKSETKLSKAKQTAEQANAAKSEFLANMSHEIRTPIHAITGMAYLLNMTALSDKQQDYINNINNASHNLLNIINHILDISKLEAGKVVIENTVFKLDNVIDNAISLVLIKAREKKLEVIIDVNMDVPILLIGDPLRLGQVLTNLMSNAIKFTESGEIWIRVRVVHQGENQVRLLFSVKDTGIGMTRVQQKRVLEAFTQADSGTTRKYGGTGLGLTISKQLIALMGGELFIKSRLHKGTTISFELAFNQPDEQLMPMRFAAGKIKGLLVLPPSRYLSYITHTGGKLKNLRVLVVDDNESAREVVQNMLSAFTLKVELAADGDEAIRMLRSDAANGEKPVDLLIIDWKMPGSDGIQTFKKIKEDPEIHHIPECILMSASEDATLIDEAKSAGIKYIIEKPLNYSIMFNKIVQVYEKEVKSYYREEVSELPAVDSLRSIAGAHILLVEDNEINQQVSRELLVSRGFRVTVAGNGKEAYQKFISNPDEFDLILMDIQMPVMDGYESARQIRLYENDFMKHDVSERNPIPIIAMTADVLSHVKQDTQDAGMNDYLGKPVNPEVLYQMLIQWIPPSGTPQIESNHKQSSLKVSVNKALAINTEDGLRRVNNNEALYMRLLTQFYQKYQSFPELLNEALLNDFETAGRLVHTLKGVSGNLGATKLFEKARYVDAELKKSGPGHPVNGLETLYLSLETVLREIDTMNLAEFRQMKKSTQNQPVSFREILPVVKQLHMKISESDTESLHVLEELLGYNMEDSLFKALNELYDILSTYEFDQALSLLKQITNRYAMDEPNE